MTTTQQDDLIRGIEISPKAGHDFQPLAAGQYVTAYAWARAVIVDPDYSYQRGDKILFTLSGEGASFYGTTLTVVTLPVGMLDSGDFGVDTQNDLKFQSTGAEQVTLSAVLGRDTAVAGSRDFTFKALPVASATNLGCVVVGEGLAITQDGVLSAAGGGEGYTLQPATASTLGGVKQGANVKIDSDGTLSVADPGSITLPAATTSTLGGVIVGDGLHVASDGTTSLAQASTIQLGGIKQGDYVTVSNGKLSVDAAALTPHLGYASANAYGTAKAGDGLTGINGVFAVDYITVVDKFPRASTSQYGVVKLGTGMSESNGALNVNTASASVAGIVQLASTSEVATGADSAKAVTSASIKSAYLPKSNPAVDGAVTISEDQTAPNYTVADRELVTAAWVKQQFEHGGVAMPQRKVILPGLLEPGCSLPEVIANFRGGDWIVLTSFDNFDVDYDIYLDTATLSALNQSDFIYVKNLCKDGTKQKLSVRIGDGFSFDYHQDHSGSSENVCVLEPGTQASFLYVRPMKFGTYLNKLLVTFENFTTTN
ncbi:hypothetical protein [Pandoraea bronchicola]|uniref:Uncharacterized protein n=1 Tax=Pandoraea bronchicola TaxID=2508287 RepID=A0A5E5BY90_9BURK|nr:hypothetical protein [Pandoraea bronchicola]VVE90524.1 hypothetical protein PBR20603_04509 [Pandoraea bronchicola]